MDKMFYLACLTHINNIKNICQEVCIKYFYKKCKMAVILAKIKKNYASQT